VSKRTFFFGGGKAEGTKEMKNLLGGKGANLAEMANIGLPVPPGFTITTEVCTEFYAGGKKLPKALDGDFAPRSRRWRSWWARSSATPRTRCWFRSARARARRCPA
jgi:pyruvate,orthophosphate dikinase